MSATVSPPRIVHCNICQGRLWWVVHYATEDFMTLTPGTVPSDHSGAMVLIGRVAYTRAAGVVRIAEMFGISEEHADRVARDEYTWHLPHRRICISRQLP